MAKSLYDFCIESDEFELGIKKRTDHLHRVMYQKQAIRRSGGVVLLVIVGKLLFTLAPDSTPAVHIAREENCSHL